MSERGWSLWIKRTIFDEMIFGQTLQAACAGKTLGQDETCGDGELFPLTIGPAIDVLKEKRESRTLKRSLEVFISGTQTRELEHECRL